MSLLHPNNPPASPGGTTPTPASGLTIVSAAGATTGTTKVTVTPAIGASNKYMYATTGNVIIPNVNDIATTGFTAWDGVADITAKTGDEILIIEVDASNKILKAGKTTVTSKA